MALFIIMREGLPQCPSAVTVSRKAQAGMLRDHLNRPVTMPQEHNLLWLSCKSGSLLGTAFSFTRKFASDHLYNDFYGTNGWHAVEIMRVERWTIQLRALIGFSAYVKEDHNIVYNRASLCLCFYIEYTTAKRPSLHSRLSNSVRSNHLLMTPRCWTKGKHDTAR